MALLQRERQEYKKMKKNEMGKASSTKGENRNAYRILVGKSKGKKPLEN
jgi:hypothetical protein